MANQWVRIASFATGVEAEMAREQLKAAGISVIIHSEGSGLFGPGFQGTLPSGVAVSVPVADVKEARELLQGGNA